MIHKVVILIVKDFGNEEHDRTRNGPMVNSHGRVDKKDANCRAYRP